MAAKCNRLWEAEALDDGRLSGVDRASFERHRATCNECDAELAALARLRSALLVIDAPPQAPLEKQRQRASLLRRANDLVTKEGDRPERREGARAALGVVLAVAVGAAAITIVVRTHRADRVDVRPETLGVLPTAPAATSTSMVPDRAGTSAAATNEPAVSASAPTPPPSSRPPSAPARRPAGAAFDEAFASFERGSYGVADVQLERFVHEFPGDPRAEDAAYLRAVARSRLGDREGAKLLARAYLDAYPNGLRGLEAKRLAEP